MNKTEEIIKIDKISKLLKKAPTDDGTFYGALYDLYVFIGITKGVNNINNNRVITVKELQKEMERIYENTSRKFS